MFVIQRRIEDQRVDTQLARHPKLARFRVRRQQRGRKEARTGLPECAPGTRKTKLPEPRVVILRSPSRLVCNPSEYSQ